MTDDPMTGAEVYSRRADRLRTFLSTLASPDWERPAIRDLDVQQLLGHLIGVEEDFARTLDGWDGAAQADHVESTQARALAQRDRLPQDTLGDWVGAVARTKDRLGRADPDRPVSFHGYTLDLDSFLVVRGFELWTHEEDICRAVDCPLADPEVAVLSRMTALAVPLLPVGMSAVGAEVSGRARLVLVGAGGGGWDVPASGTPTRATLGQSHDALITVDAATFCRVVANRASFDSSQVAVEGDRDLARTLFAAASSLALD